MDTVKSFLMLRLKATMLLSVSIFIIGLLFFNIGYNETWELWNVPHMTPHFADLRSITGGAESYAKGIDPMIQNPGDPWGRVMNYPRIWQTLYSIGINQQHTTVLGIFFITLFGIGVLIILPKATIETIIFVLAAIFSPATLLGIERGNIDLLLFFIVALAILFTGTRHYLSFLAILAGFLLKLFPVFSFLILIRANRSLFLKYLVILVFFISAYTYITYSDLLLIRAGTPKSTSLSYGVNVFWMAAMSSNAALGWLSKVMAYLSLIIILLLSWGALLKKGLSCEHVSSKGICLDAFRAGSAIYIGTFMLGNNWDYRLVFLIFTIPQLVNWASSNANKIRLISRLTLVSIFLSLWYLKWKNAINLMPYGNYASFTLDEISNWSAFGGLMYLLFWSMPDWVKALAEKMQASLSRLSCLKRNNVTH